MSVASVLTLVQWDISLLNVCDLIPGCDVTALSGVQDTLMICVLVWLYPKAS